MKKTTLVMSPAFAEAISEIGKLGGIPCAIVYVTPGPDPTAPADNVMLHISVDEEAMTPEVVEGICELFQDVGRSIAQEVKQ